MKKIISIKLKATLLLIVFSLNTMISFACSMGIDMGYNHKDHDEEQKEPAVAEHYQNETTTFHHNKVNSETDNDGCCKGGCCNDPVTKFNLSDKQTSENIQVNPIFAVDFIHQHILPVILKPIDVVNNGFNKERLRQHSPPDLLVLYQTFLI